MDEDKIFDVLTSALLSARLTPGTKLGEQKLSGIFGVTRERIRKVLHKLGNRRMIEVIPNRGAFVVNASLYETRELYEARRIVESGILVSIVETASDAEVAGLELHIVSEREALPANDNAISSRLSGDFHMELARLTGNGFVIRQMQELVIRTIMLDNLFKAELSHNCSVDEHGVILAALKARDAVAAVEAMTRHLLLVERRFKPAVAAPEKCDLDAVLRAEINRWEQNTRSTVT